MSFATSIKVEVSVAVPNERQSLVLHAAEYTACLLVAGLTRLK